MGGLLGLDTLGLGLLGCEVAAAVEVAEEYEHLDVVNKLGPCQGAREDCLVGQDTDGVCEQGGGGVRRGKNSWEVLGMGERERDMERENGGGEGGREGKSEGGGREVGGRKGKGVEGEGEDG